MLTVNLSFFLHRYADQVVHRQLEAAIGWSKEWGGAQHEPEYADGDGAGSNGVPTAEVLVDLCSALNGRHALAQHAERASAELYTLCYFKVSLPSASTPARPLLDAEASIFDCSRICSSLSFFWQNRTEVEKAYIMKVTKAGVNLLIPRFGNR